MATMLSTISNHKMLVSLVLFCLCNTTPVIAGGGFRYTAEEESFIIDEIEKYPAEIKPIYGFKIWETISQKYSQMLTHDSTTFWYGRSPIALRNYFLKKMLKKKGKVPIPPSLLEKLSSAHQTNNDDISESQQSGDSVGNKRNRAHESYNSDEDAFLLERILSYPRRPIPVHGRKLWKGIAKRFEEKNRINPTKFPHGRTWKALQSHFLHMLRSKFNSQERANWMEEIRKGATLSIRTTHSSEAGYTPEEEEFLIKEVLSYPERPVPIYGMKMWPKVAVKFQEQRSTNPDQFPYERSAKSLQSHFRHILESMVEGEDKDKFLNEIRRSAPTEDMGNKRIRAYDTYCPEEDQFLIDEVIFYPQRPVPIYGTTMWLKVLDHLEERRNLSPDQFPYERTAESLKQRFRYLLASKFKGKERDDLMEEIRRETRTDSEDTAEDDPEKRDNDDPSI